MGPVVISLLSAFIGLAVGLIPVYYSGVDKALISSVFPDPLKLAIFRASLCVSGNVVCGGVFRYVWRSSQQILDVYCVQLFYSFFRMALAING